MKTDDLTSALRVAERACLSAQKEAAWVFENPDLTDQEDKRLIEIKKLLLDARCLLGDALTKTEES